MRKVEDRNCESGSISTSLPMNGRNRLWFPSFSYSALLFELPAMCLGDPDISHHFRPAFSSTAWFELAIIASTGGGCQDSVSLQAGPE